MKRTRGRKVVSVVCAAAIAVSSFVGTSLPVSAGLGYWPEDLPISNEYYWENTSLQPYGACFLIDELKNWTPDNDPDARYNRGSIPLKERWMGPSVNENASRDAKVMPLGGTSARASQGPSQGGNDAYSYAFTYFQYVDTYNYWGGSSAEGPIAIPTPEHIDSSHKNGVRATGTIFIPWGDYTYGEQFIRELTEKKDDGSFPAADKLIEIAQYYGFDGYIINQESSSDAASMARFKEMLAYIQEKAPDNFTMSWYNGSGSLNDSAIDSWMQDGDTRINDEWWLDMSWRGIDGTIDAALNAGRSPFDIHASWENFPYTDKGANVANLLGADNKLKCSLGILGPNNTLISSNSIEDFMNNTDVKQWTGPTGDPRDTSDNSVWCGFARLIADQTPIIGTEFTTTFNPGNGYQFYENGEVTGKESGWYNRSIMDVMPTWRWIVDSEGTTKLTPIIDYYDAWWGGASMKVSGNLEAGKANTIQLYSTQLDITSTSKVSVTYKTPAPDVNLSVGLCFGDDYSAENFKWYSIDVTKAGEWATATADLSADAGKKAIAISLKYESDADVSDYSMNVGRLAITENDDAPEATSEVIYDEYIYHDDNTAEARVYWEKAEDAAMYVIHRVHPDGTKEFIGATPSDAFYLGEFKRDGDETSFKFEITSYSETGLKGGTKEFSFRWPEVTNGFEDIGEEGENIALKVPAVDDGSFDPGGKIDKINDGVIPNSKWCSSKTNASAYLDLGKEYDISRWVVKHANVEGAGEGVNFNTVNFNLQYAPDDGAEILNPDDTASKNRVIGLTYTKVDEVTGNSQDITDRLLQEPIKARYIRLHVTKSDNCPWHAIRIYEFELYENAYFPHSEALLERNITIDNNVGDVDKVVFNNVAMPISSSGTVAEDTGIVRLYDSLTAEEPIAEKRASLDTVLQQQRHKGVAIFDDIKLNPEGGRLYYTTTQNGVVSARNSVAYGPEAGETVKAPTAIKLEQSVRGSQPRDSYGILTMTGLDEGVSLEIYESADAHSPILFSRPVQPGEDFIRQERVPLNAEGGTIYYELKQEGKTDFARYAYEYGPVAELGADMTTLKELAARYADYNEADFIASTWTAFAEARSAVNALIEAGAPNAAEAMEARAALEAAACALRRPANIQRFEEYVNECAAIMENKDAYDASTWDKFEEAYNNAKDVLDGIKDGTNVVDRLGMEDAYIKLIAGRNQLAIYVPVTVTVSENETIMAKGDSKEFSATVDGSGYIDRTVTWSVWGNNSADTKMEGSTLTVAADETSKFLKVIATSVEDPTKSAFALVCVYDPADIENGAKNADILVTNSTAGDPSLMFDGDYTTMWEAPAESTYVVFDLGDPVDAEVFKMFLAGSVEGNENKNISSYNFYQLKTSAMTEEEFLALDEEGRKEAANYYYNWTTITYEYYNSADVVSKNVNITNGRIFKLAVNGYIQTPINIYELELTAKPKPAPGIIDMTIPDEFDWIIPGKSHQFTVNVEVYGDADNTVTWSVSGNDSADTVINNGLLFVGADETSKKITIRATSNFDESSFVEKTINVKVVNKYALELLVNYANTEKESADYQYVIPAVKTVFEKALADAEEVLANKSATQEEVDAAYDELLEKVWMLEFTGNKENLQDLYDFASELPFDCYTDKTAEEVKAALEEAKAVLDNENALQEEIDAAYDALKAAVDGLDTKVDKSELEALVKRAEAIDLSKYLDTSKTDFNPALEHAKAVLADEDATVADVYEAYNRLSKAIFDLRLIPDKSLLESLINTAEAVNQNDYTEESVVMLNEALAEAIAVFQNEEASEEEVKAAEAGLENALNALEEKEPDNNDPIDPEKPDDSDNKGDEGVDSPDTSDYAPFAAPAVLALAAAVAAFFYNKKRSMR